MKPEVTIYLMGVLTGALGLGAIIAASNPFFALPGQELSTPSAYMNMSDNFEQNYIQSNNHDIGVYHLEDEMVSVEADRTARIRGKSMRPTIFHGHTVLYREYDNETMELEQGDIISFERDDGGTTVHRIEGDYLDTSGYVVTRGDNNRAGERVEEEQIKSIVVGTIYTDK